MPASMLFCRRLSACIPKNRHTAAATTAMPAISPPSIRRSPASLPRSRSARRSCFSRSRRSCSSASACSSCRASSSSSRRRRSSSSRARRTASSSGRDSAERPRSSSSVVQPEPAGSRQIRDSSAHRPAETPGTAGRGSPDRRRFSASWLRAASCAKGASPPFSSQNSSMAAEYPCRWAGESSIQNPSGRTLSAPGHSGVSSGSPCSLRKTQSGCRYWGRNPAADADRQTRHSASPSRCTAFSSRSPAGQALRSGWAYSVSRYSSRSDGSSR